MLHLGMVNNMKRMTMSFTLNLKNERKKYKFTPLTTQHKNKSHKVSQIKWHQTSYYPNNIYTIYRIGNHIQATIQKIKVSRQKGQTSQWKKLP